MFANNDMDVNTVVISQLVTILLASSLPLAACI